MLLMEMFGGRSNGKRRSKTQGSDEPRQDGLHEEGVWRRVFGEIRNADAVWSIYTGGYKQLLGTF